MSRPVHVAEPLTAPPQPRGFLLRLAMPAPALSAAITVVLVPAGPGGRVPDPGDA